MSKLKLVIGNKNYSSWSLRPWFFLKNLEIDFDEELVFLFEEDTNENLKSYFSNDKVPVLVDGDLQVWDTLAIIETITEQYPEKQGWPEDAKTRAIARSVSAEMHSSFFALREALPMNVKNHFPDFQITDEVQTDINRVVELWEYCKQNATKEGSWLFGGFSAADAMFAPVVMRFVSYDVKLSGLSGLSDVAVEYVDFVLHNVYMQEWIEAGKQETHVIQHDEI